MTSNNLLADIRNYFISNYMNVVDEWLEGCVDYLKELYGNDINKIQEEAKQQWLLNDLEDVCTGSLPEGILEQQQIILNGIYVLQIQSIRDIGTPAYQQYLELQKVNMENIDATTRHEDKVSNRRMFKLQLTDGVQDISAIEYEPIRGLNSDIPKQSKLFITGPVTCRRGCLLLKEPCIQLLNMEMQQVPSIQEPNNTKINNVNAIRVHGAHDTQVNVGPTLEQPEAWVDDNMKKSEAFEADHSANNKRSLTETNNNPEKRPRIDFDDDDDVFKFEDEDCLRELHVQCDNMDATQRAVSAEPYVFIKQLLEIPEEDRAGKTFTVKALIVKLLDKLSVGAEGWRLRCRVADGSGSLDALLSAPLLADLVRLAPDRLMRLRRRMDSEPQLKLDLVQALQKAKETLQVLYCLMDITFLDVPTITKHTPFDHSHTNLLIKRNSTI